MKEHVREGVSLRLMRLEPNMVLRYHLSGMSSAASADWHHKSSLQPASSRRQFLIRTRMPAALSWWAVALITAALLLHQEANHEPVRPASERSLRSERRPPSAHQLL